MNRQQARHAALLERRALKTGDWGSWEVTYLPEGIPGGGGWCRDVRAVHKNDLYVVLVRPLMTVWGKVLHCAIRTASSLEPPWRDKQRMKNELFGPDFTAVEVMPPADELVDEADMYHIWVLPLSAPLPFSLQNPERKAIAA